MFRSPSQILLVGIISGTFALGCTYTTHRLVTWHDKHASKITLVKFFGFTGFGLWVIRLILLSWFISFTPIYSLVYKVTEKLSLPLSNHFIATTGAFFMVVVVIMAYNYIVYSRFVFTKDRG